MKNYSKKRATLERNRFSILSEDKDHCYICHTPFDLTWHELFEGASRKNSMIYGCCIRVCLRCHNRIQSNDLIYKKQCKQKFEEVYPDLDFQKIFHSKYTI